MSLVDVFRGPGYLFRGFGMLTKPGIRRYAAGPIAAALVLYGAIAWISRTYFERLAATIEGYLPAWFLEWGHWILWILYIVLAGGILLVTFVLAVNLVGAPFNTLLAEAVELRLTGRRAPSVPLHLFLRRVPGIILTELKKLLYFAVWCVPFLIFFLIPPINVAAPFLWYLFCSWMFALTSADYAMDNDGVPFREMRRRLKENFALATGFGAAGFFLATVPIVNLFVMPAAVAGATIMWVERLRGPRLPPA